MTNRHALDALRNILLCEPAVSRAVVVSGTSSQQEAIVAPSGAPAVTAMADLGVDATVADRVLNHVGAGTMGTVKRVYQRSELLDQRRDALERWSVYAINAAVPGASLNAGGQQRPSSN